jgi:4-carboxymuconolactone decarboxylase
MRLPALTELTPASAGDQRRHRQQARCHKKAIAAGVSAESIKELAREEVPHFAHADEQLLYSLGTQILRDHFVDSETFDAALTEWGEDGLVDIIGCLGNFSMLAMLLNTFEVDLKAGDEPPFPDVRGFAKVKAE